MLRSGLFDRWYVPSATAVAWYYEGEGGGLTYWPDGPDRAPIHRPCISNSAVVGDNDYMLHRVEAVGPEDRTLPKGLTLNSQLCRNDDRWEVVEQGDLRARYEFEEVRVSVSCKAQVFADAGQLALYENHLGDTLRVFKYAILHGFSDKDRSALWLSWSPKRCDLCGRNPVIPVG